MLAALARDTGATTFTHSAGYFVLAAGNSQRAVLGLFGDDAWMSVTRVVAGSILRRPAW